MSNISSLISTIYLPTIRSKKAVSVEELSNLSDSSFFYRSTLCNFSSSKKQAHIGSIQLLNRLSSIKRTLRQINVNTVDLLSLLVESNIQDISWMIDVSKTNELVT